MKRLILMACVAALFFVSEAQASDHPVHLDVLKRMDRDGDGMVQPREVPKGAKLYVADLAKEAGLDPTQPICLGRLARRLQYRQDHAAPVHVVIRLDRNADGVLTPDEIPKEAAAFVKRVAKEAGHAKGPIQLKSLHERHMTRFHKLPDSHFDDSKIKGAKLTSPKQALEAAAILISIYDANDDKVLHKKEWHRLHADWGQHDKNKDGKLSDKEIASGLHTVGNP